MHIRAASGELQQSHPILPPSLLPGFLKDTACRVLALRSGNYTDGSANSIAAIPKGAWGDPRSLQAISGCFS